MNISAGVRLSLNVTLSSVPRVAFFLPFDISAPSSNRLPPLAARLAFAARRAK